MNGRQLVLDLLNKKENNARVPWIPFTGVHAGSLVGYNATEVLSDANKLFEAVVQSNKLYTPDGQPVVFDLQIEAELLGCTLQWEDYSPPSVRTHPLSSTDEIPCLCNIPTKHQGRLPMILDVMKRLKKEIGNETALFGLITGPFTLASHLRGSNIFMDMYDDEKYVKDLLSFCVEINKVFSDYYVEVGMDVIAVVDPLVSQISPTHFKDFLSKPFTEVFEYIKELGVNSSFFVCGNASNNIEVMCNTNPDSIFVDENVDLVTAKIITDKYNIVIGGNIPLTSVMLHGTQQDNMKYTVDLIDSLTHNKLIISPGCDMPYHVPAKNVIAVAQGVLHTDEIRDMVKNYESPDNNIIVDLPDYDKLIKPLIEVFTLDSATCAACTYMMAAANEAKKHFGDTIDVIEYKYTIKENISRCEKMGVSNLPSIYINGKLKHSSIIPSRVILFNEIEQAKEALN